MENWEAVIRGMHGNGEANVGKDPVDLGKISDVGGGILPIMGKTR